MKAETIPPLNPIEYPDSDGQPMAENTRQYDFIVYIKTNLDVLFAARDDVFVAGDLLWYARFGDPKERLAPDAMVAFGRPKGYRGSYKQWEEGGIPPQVVWEVLSPGNTTREMAEKRAFYERHGVEEYYEYDPDRGLLRGWIRQDDALGQLDETQGYVSPLLGVRMELNGDDLVLYRPDGTPFKTLQESEDQTQRERLAKEKAEQRADQLAARLRALGIDPDQES
jgi:Uma2 family endonuclease